MEGLLYNTPIPKLKLKFKNTTFIISKSRSNFGKKPKTKTKFWQDNTIMDRNNTDL